MRNEPRLRTRRLGWRLAGRLWRRGFASEAAAEAVAFGFTRHDLGEVVSFTVVRSRRSRGVMERLGMRRDREADFDHPLAGGDERLRRHVLYRLSRADWMARRSTAAGVS